MIDDESPAVEYPEEVTAAGVLTQYALALEAYEEAEAEAERTQQANRADEEFYELYEWSSILVQLTAMSHALPLVGLPNANQPGEDEFPEHLEKCRQAVDLMQQSGEMKKREDLYRDFRRTLYQTPRPDPQDYRAVDDEHTRLMSWYWIEAQKIAEEHRTEYGKPSQKTFHERPSSIAPPGKKSSRQILPPATSLLFDACHVGRQEFQPSIFGDYAGLEYARGDNRIRLDIGTKAPPEVTNAYAKPELIKTYISAGEEGRVLAANLNQLDAMAWDVAALAVTAFYTRTKGESTETAFPLLIEDYFEWRKVPSEHRTRAMRHEIRKRIELLASDAVKIVARTELFLPDQATGKKKKTPVVTRGAFLDGKTEFWVSGQSVLPNLTDDPPDGFMTRLGSWAEPFITQRTMIGVALKRLGEYNLRTEAWERQIGWYLTFQMNNQGSNMQRENGKLKPQHPLFMRTVLNGSHIPEWENKAKTNAGRVLQQWVDCLKTLQQDGIIAAPECVDGAWDGSDLKTPSGKLMKGGLDIMLGRRYNFLPGPEQMKNIQAKNEIAREARQKTAIKREAAKKKTTSKTPS